MLALIGGLMLASAVGAMVLLAGWSLARDNDPDSRPRDGILALRDWSGLKKKAVTPEKTRAAAKEPARPRRKAAPLRDGVAIRKPRKQSFTPHEIADVEDDILRREQEKIQAEHEAAMAEFSIRRKRQGSPA